MGIVTADMLAKRRYPATLWTCGGVELRADGLPPGEIAGAVADFDTEKERRRFAGPVIFTLRLRRDGGAWEDADAAARAAVWESLPPGTCDWADLEIEEVANVPDVALDALRSSGVKLLLSHHAFAPESPEEWTARLDAMRALGPDGVKFAVSPTSDQIPDLLDFAKRVGSEFSDSCVLGMGEAGRPTRLISPLLGCPFTYGYLGEGPVAPGQLDVESMRRFFEQAVRPDSGQPPREAPAAVWLDWEKKVRGA